MIICQEILSVSLPNYYWKRLNWPYNGQIPYKLIAHYFLDLPTTLKSKGTSVWIEVEWIG